MCFTVEKKLMNSCTTQANGERKQYSKKSKEQNCLNYKEVKRMTRKRIRARTALAARNKCKGPRTTVTKVNYIPGTERKGQRTYAVTTKKKK
jgi:hypothetical protein